MKIPERLRVALLHRVLRTMASRPPDFTVGPADDPYLHRWWAIPRNKLFNIYLHQFVRDDNDEALHDHPWVNLSVILDGKYDEVVLANLKTFKKALEGKDGAPPDLTFYRLTLSRGMWLPDAIRRRVGLGMQIGAPLARVMGPDEDLAKVFAGPVDVFVHERCASNIIHLLELFPKEEDDGAQSGS